MRANPSIDPLAIWRANQVEADADAEAEAGDASG